MFNWLRRLLYKPQVVRGKSPTNLLIGDLKWIARRTPQGQRAKRIKEVLSEHDYSKHEVWRK